MCVLCETTGACVHVSAFLWASVWTWESECPWSSGKKMSYGISDYMLQWRTVFSFFSPNETESPGHCESIWRLESDPELWSDLDPKQREEPCQETNSLVLCDLCGVEFHPLFCTVKSVSRWREKLSVKFKMHFNDVKLHTECEVDFCLYHVCHCVLCHRDSFLHVQCISSHSKSEAKMWHNEAYFFLWKSCSELYVPTLLYHMHSLWFLYKVSCM